MRKIIFIIAFVITGCGPLHRLDLSTISVEMDKQEVQEKLQRPPEQVIGSKLYRNGKVEVCAYGVPAFDQNGDLYRQYYWLYFFNDTLVQWGRPGDWQVESDNIYELRIR